LVRAVVLGLDSEVGKGAALGEVVVSEEAVVLVGALAEGSGRAAALGLGLVAGKVEVVASEEEAVLVEVVVLAEGSDMAVGLEVDLEVGKVAD
jgi:chitinase